MPPEIPTFPKLPVERSTYCSQQCVDEAIGGLCAKAPGLINGFAQLECDGFRTQEYFGFLVDINREIEAYHLIPEGNDLAVVDALYELSRRIRNHFGLKEILAQGCELDTNQDYRAKTSPVSSLAASSGFDLKQVNDILRYSYNEDRDVWFGYSEALRRNVYCDRLSKKLREGLNNSSLHIAGSDMGPACSADALEQMKVLAGLTEDKMAILHGHK